MIEPNMATMLCFVQTDAVVEDPDAALRAAVDASFERITVDGQMSTNDTVLLQATGAAGAAAARRACSRRCCCSWRSRSSRDGEGAARVGRVEVERAAIAGRGRAGRPRDRQLAAGQDGALRPRPQLGPDRPGGRRWRWPARTWRRSAPTRSTPPSSAAETAEAEIGLRLGRGEHRAHVWFSDLGYEYVRINAEYTT